jgi:hypothetical protein
MARGDTLAPAGLVAAIQRELIRCQKMPINTQARVIAQAAVRWTGDRLARPVRTPRLLDERALLQRSICEPSASS